MDIVQPSRSLPLMALVFLGAATAAAGWLYFTDSWLLPTPYVARLFGYLFLLGAAPLLALVVYLSAATRHGYLSIALIAGAFIGVMIRYVPMLPKFPH